MGTMEDKQSKPVRRFITRAAKHAVGIVVYGIFGALLCIIILFVVILERRPDLETWHTVHLRGEFTAAEPVASFDEYLAIEDRLFAQLDDRVYAAVPAEDRNQVNRYHRGSLSDPRRWPTDWNRT